MKKSKDWVRQEDLDAMLDTFVEEMGGIPAGMRPNEVADRLGLTANGKFYRQFRDWKRRREAEADLPALDIPEDAKLELESVLADTREQVMDHFARVVRMVTGDVDRTATLRVRAAERRATESEAEAEDILEQWNETERDLEVARERVASAERETEKLRRELDRVRGQLEERGHLLKALRDRPFSSGREPVESSTGPSKVDATSGGDRDDRASGAGSGSAEHSPGKASSASEPSATEPKHDGPQGPGQSSINEADGRQVHQTELSLGVTGNADKAEADDDDND